MSNMRSEDERVAIAAVESDGRDDHREEFEYESDTSDDSPLGPLYVLSR